MAQTGFTPIQLYSTSTAAAVPVAGNLTNSTLGSELAINITDGKLFYKDNANAVQVIGWKTVPTTAGGTGLTTYTAGDLSYYATGTTFTKLAIGTTGQILTSTGSAPQWTTLSGVAVTTFSAGTTGFTPNSATSGAVTLAGTLATTNGGTGLTSFTANRVFYASSTSAIGSSANLTFNGTTLVANDITDSSLTATRVTYAGTSGNLVDSANLTFNGITLTSGGYSTNGNLTFTGTGNRIFGDFSTTTLADRVIFQTSTVNGNSILHVLPSGTASISQLQLGNNSDINNQGFFQFSSGSVVMQINAGSRGTGTFLPIGINAGGSERLRVFTSGGVSIGNTTDPGATNLSVNGNAYIGNTTTSAAAERFNVNGFGGFGDRTATNPFVLVGDTGSGNGVIGTYSNHALEIRTNNTSRATFTTGGGFTCVGIYNTTVGATNRDVFVDNTGVVGYVTSTRSSKTNIENLTDTSWLYQLNPVTFNYRKRDENGQYTNDIDGDIQYGLIAEDVEQVRPDLCFYDETENGRELRGIQYSKLVPVMLKAIQELNAKVEAMKGAK